MLQAAHPPCARVLFSAVEGMGVTFTEDNWQQTAAVDPVIPKYQTIQAVVAFLAVGAMNDGVWKAKYLGLANLRTYPESRTRFGPVKLPSFSVCGRFLQWRRATTPAQ